MNLARPIPELTDVDKARYWLKVCVRDDNSCWPWAGFTDRHGYGTFSIRGSKYLSHRVSLALDGRNPGDLYARHRCDNRPCCNPSHLEIGTIADNSRDMVERGRCNSPKGRSHGRAKLTENDVALIRADGRLLRIIGAQYGVTGQQIGRIKRQARWAL